MVVVGLAVGKGDDLEGLEGLEDSDGLERLEEEGGLEGEVGVNVIFERHADSHSERMESYVASPESER